MNPVCTAKPTWLGRYAIFDEIAAGGMATVYLARLSAPMGFSRVVAIKRLHPHLLKNVEFTKMFVEEARLAARVRHPNVVPTLDVLVNEGEVVLVMEYVHGESLLALRRLVNQQGSRIPIEIATAIMLNVLQGLHAAHEARDEGGEPLGIVHRDVSPHNVLLGADGVARVLDFGVAKAMDFQSDTGRGMVKGKHSYMAPEVLRSQTVTRQADVFAAATVFWELLTGRKLFTGSTDPERMLKILAGGYPPPSSAAPDVPAIIDRIVMKGLDPDPKYRYPTAIDMAVELEGGFAPASQRIVSDWVTQIAAESLERRAQLLQQIEISQIGPVPVVNAGNASSRASLDPALLNEYAIGAIRPAPVHRDKTWLVLATAGLAIGVLGVGLATATHFGGPSRAQASSHSAGVTIPTSPATSELPQSSSIGATSASSAGLPPANGTPSVAVADAPPAASVAAPSPSVDLDWEAPSARPSVPPSTRRPSAHGIRNGNIKDFLPDEL